MRSKLLGPILVLEFLVAIDAGFMLWSQVGGQYHLDIMFWPWKLGVILAAASLVTAMTAEFARSGGFTARAKMLAVALLLVATIAGALTYYYHVHEPDDEDDTSPAQTMQI